MFETPVNDETVCKTIIHDIKTTTDSPAAQRNFQAPQAPEKEIAKKSKI